MVLDTLSLDFAVQAAIGSWVVDFLVGDIVIQVDGAYWHAQTVERDGRKTRELTATGYTVIRVPEEIVLAPDFDQWLAHRLCRERNRPASASPAA